MADDSLEVPLSPGGEPLIGDWWILNDQCELVQADYATWASWNLMMIENQKRTPLCIPKTRTIASTYFHDNTHVSTVILQSPTDLPQDRLPGMPPLIFETMIFDTPKHDGYQERYRSISDARRGHIQAVELVLSDFTRDYEAIKGILGDATSESAMYEHGVTEGRRKAREEGLSVYEVWQTNRETKQNILIMSLDSIDEVNKFLDRVGRPALRGQGNVYEYSITRVQRTNVPIPKDKDE
jgi:hypothetical protein